MPRNPKHRNGAGSGGGGGKRFGKNFKHPKGKRNFKKPTGEFDKFKKFKHIQRNQESEEALRRQKEVELKSVRKSQVLESSSEEDEVSPMDQLLESLQSTKNRSAIESSDSSDEDGESEEDDSNEDIKAEDDGDDDEQIDDESESEESDSDDDLPEETILRPEESKLEAVIGKNIEDHFEENADDESDEEELDEETEKVADSPEAKDMFSIHLNNELSPDLLECVHTTHVSQTHELDWKVLGRIIVDIPSASKDASVDEVPAKKQKKNLLGENDSFAEEGCVPEKLNHKAINMTKLLIKGQMQQHILEANKVHLANVNSESVLTGLQAELFSIMNNYQDLYYPHRSHENGEEIRFTYCIHALNHLLKTCE